MAAPTFNASHQTFWLHLCEEDPHSAVLAAATHKGFGKVSDRISAQVERTEQSTNGEPRSSENGYIM